MKKLILCLIFCSSFVSCYKDTYINPNYNEIIGTWNYKVDEKHYQLYFGYDNEFMYRVKNIQSNIWLGRKGTYRTENNKVYIYYNGIDDPNFCSIYEYKIVDKYLYINYLNHDSLDYRFYKN